MAALIVPVVCACATVDDRSMYDLGSDSSVPDTVGDAGIDPIVDETGFETPEGGCPDGLTDCGGICVDLTTDARNCGLCGNVCPAPYAHTVGVCVGSVCDIECAEGWVDNDSEPGCETACSGAGVESCNGLDDDCDTVPDEDFDCVMGAILECVTTCGTYGSGVCDVFCELPTGDACTPPAEECNGIDDDCDGATDEDWPPGTCGPCTPDCTGRDCGPDPVCGTSCGTCTPPETCDASGLCTCTPDCAGRDCGLDPVCGTSCGTCTPPETCDASGLCTCTPDCSGRVCGPDPVCGESCGTCTAPSTCSTAGQCESPCSLYFFTDFSATCTPSGWSISDWRCQNFNNYTGGSGMYRTANSFGEVTDASMLTDWFDATGCTSVFLDFKHRYNDYSGSTDAAYVDITFNGTDWTNVVTHTADDDLPQHLDLDRGTWGTENLFKIRFRYVGDNDGCWDVDDVEITGS